MEEVRECTDQAFRVIADFEEYINNVRKRENKNDSIDKIINQVDLAYKRAQEIEQKEDELKTMERYFICLGMIKKIIESGLLDL